ncbi:MAG: glutamate racemase [Candidatus Lindowbacteria bacterium RIFCSPLOWO2_12_FULL_62_27]|nr:MAG: glutamate racemase [Candidatus Lindowbacteria bacterium RIFCSPLOWO2_12_FULL_62_27]OGH63979.1 MAG: glutamate racemase [Candidatus Lindowbacteria bacterium RIFCSPLOWO2_02_FULL_62_12]
MNRNRPIGIFDSGLGGLTVLRAFRAKFANEEFIYYADTRHVPYGEKSPDEIRALAMNIVDYLVRRNVKMIAFGCNISSAVALEEAREKYPDIPMAGLISQSLAEEARKNSGGKIGVIATTATVSTGRYPLVLKSGAENIEVFMCACPVFVPLIESGKTAGPEVDAAVESSMEMLVSARIDTLIYGCSHYLLLEEPIRAFFQRHGMAPRPVDPALPLVADTKATLRKSKIDNIRLGSGVTKFVVSGSKPSFKENLRKLSTPFFESMVFAPAEMDEELHPIL